MKKGDREKTRSERKERKEELRKGDRDKKGVRGR